MNTLFSIYCSYSLIFSYWDQQQRDQVIVVQIVVSLTNSLLKNLLIFMENSYLTVGKSRGFSRKH